MECRSRRFIVREAKLDAQTRATLEDTKMQPSTTFSAKLHSSALRCVLAGCVVVLGLLATEAAVDLRAERTDAGSDLDRCAPGGSFTRDTGRIIRSCGLLAASFFPTMSSPQESDLASAMCDAAREAREKNTPAAQTLEARCQSTRGDPAQPDAAAATNVPSRPNRGARGPGSRPPYPHETRAAQTTDIERQASFRDWGGVWDLEWQFDGKWYGKILTLKSTPSGIAGDYIVGILEGRFVQGEFSNVTGEITNVTNTGSTCSSGKQSGSFALNLASDGRSMEGWWDVCGAGEKRTWRARRRGDTDASHSGAVQNMLTFRDWSGTWDLEWTFQGKVYGRAMNLTASPTGIAGDYVLGVLEGRFTQGSAANVTGVITNTTNTGTTCPSLGRHGLNGKQAGLFSLTLAPDGRSMQGWWDVCGVGEKWPWKAQRR